MKKVVVLVLAFLLYAPSASAQSIPIAGEDQERANPTQGCGATEFYCEMVTFVDFDTGTSGSMSAVVVQRIDADEFTAEMFMSDKGAMEFFAGIEFYGYMDYTAQHDLMSDATPTPLMWEYRVFEGRSDTIEKRDDAVIYILRSTENEVFVIMAIEPTPVVEDYVKDIMAGEDWMKEPRGFILFEG